MIFNKRDNDYRQIFFIYQDMMTKVTMEADKALMTFSIAGLAALAALNDTVFSKYGYLSFFTFLCFIIVVITVIIGYCISKSMIIDAQDNLTKNYQDSVITPLNKNAEDLRFKKLSKLLNFLSMFFFILAMVFFVTLMAIYIKGIEV